MPPRLFIDTEKIRQNAATAVRICRDAGLALVGVTKGVHGDPAIARAFLDGGATGLADARLENLARLRDAGVSVPLTLLRSPAPSEVEACVRLADVSLNADLRVLSALSAIAVRMGRRHAVSLMADLDTGREGFSPKELIVACREVSTLPGLSLWGIGVYLGLRGDPAFHREAERKLAELSEAARVAIGRPLPVVSGGSSDILRHVAAGTFLLPAAINELRIGTAIVLGIYSSVGPRELPGFHRDAFVLEAELIEVKPDNGVGILALGKVDVDPDTIFPLDPVVSLIGVTSDHAIVDLSRLPASLAPGAKLRFLLGYASLYRALLSPYVEKKRISFARGYPSLDR